MLRKSSINEDRAFRIILALFLWDKSTTVWGLFADLSDQPSYWLSKSSHDIPALLETLTRMRPPNTSILSRISKRGCLEVAVSFTCWLKNSRVRAVQWRRRTEFLAEWQHGLWFAIMNTSILQVCDASNDKKRAMDVSTFVLTEMVPCLLKGVSCVSRPRTEHFVNVTIGWIKSIEIDNCRRHRLKYVPHQNSPVQVTLALCTEVATSWMNVDVLPIR